VGSITHRTIAPAFAVPLAWTAATLVRGASIEWYPYTILDVPRIGYRPVTRTSSPSPDCLSSSPERSRVPTDG
jgi:hypothetical protein